MSETDTTIWMSGNGRVREHSQLCPFLSWAQVNWGPNIVLSELQNQPNDFCRSMQKVISIIIIRNNYWMQKSKVIAVSTADENFSFMFFYHYHLRLAAHWNVDFQLIMHIFSNQFSTASPLGVNIQWPKSLQFFF